MWIALSHWSETLQFAIGFCPRRILVRANEAPAFRIFDALRAVARRYGAPYLLAPVDQQLSALINRAAAPAGVVVVFTQAPASILTQDTGTATTSRRELLTCCERSAFIGSNPNPGILGRKVAAFLIATANQRPGASLDFAPVAGSCEARGRHVAHTVGEHIAVYLGVVDADRRTKFRLLAQGGTAIAEAVLPLARTIDRIPRPTLPSALTIACIYRLCHAKPSHRDY